MTSRLKIESTTFGINVWSVATRPTARSLVWGTERLQFWARRAEADPRTRHESHWLQYCLYSLGAGPCRNRWWISWSSRLWFWTWPYGTPRTRVAASRLRVRRFSFYLIACKSNSVSVHNERRNNVTTTQILNQSWKKGKQNAARTWGRQKHPSLPFWQKRHEDTNLSGSRF
jgi:hypothetical protein